MNLTIHFHEAALEETDAAFTWYYTRSPRAARSFIDELTRVIEQIRRSPQLFAPYQSGARRAILRKYPFFIVFFERPGQIDILAVAHAKRHPGYWRKRQTP